MRKKIEVKEADCLNKITFKKDWLIGKDTVYFKLIEIREIVHKGFKEVEKGYNVVTGYMSTNNGEFFNTNLTKHGEKFIRELYLKHFVNSKDSEDKKE